MGIASHSNRNYSAHLGSLPHSGGLECLQVLRLSGCNYLSDPGLAHLASVKDSLSELDLSNCGGITHAGLPNLYTLRYICTEGRTYD